MILHLGRLSASRLGISILDVLDGRSQSFARGKVDNAARLHDAQGPVAGWLIEEPDEGKARVFLRLSDMPPELVPMVAESLPPRLKAAEYHPPYRRELEALLAQLDELPGKSPALVEALVAFRNKSALSGAPSVTDGHTVASDSTLARESRNSGGIKVTDEFLRAIGEIARRTPIIFITGRPGTGKTEFIKIIKREFPRKNIALTAPTGVAALLIGGQTIHSFFSIRPHEWLETGDLEPDPWFNRRVRSLDTVVVDEASMVSPNLLDAMDARLRQARQSAQPFGGVQLVLVGDLFQIPPVAPRSGPVIDKYRELYGANRFFYAAKALKGQQVRTIELTEVFRQSDVEFKAFLDSIRRGSVDEVELESFNRRALEAPGFGDADRYLLISPTKDIAERENLRRLDALPGDTMSFETVYRGDDTDAFIKHLPFGPRMELKVGAQIMFVKNDQGERWVNGDLGKIVDIAPDTLVVETRNGRHRVAREKFPHFKYEADSATGSLTPVEVGAAEQFPLVLAWAATIHKMQGQTVDKIAIDFGRGAFEPGMTYVALSRCRTREGIRLMRPIRREDIKVDESCKDWLEAALTKEKTDNRA